MKEVKKEEKQKQKLSKYEKRKLKQKKLNDLLNMRGIPKFWTTHIVEILYIFVIELIVKALLGNLIFDYALLRILLSSWILALIISIVTTNLPSKLRKSILILFNFLIFLYAWLQLGFMNFLGAFISLGNAEQGTKVTDYIFEFFCSYRPIIHTLIIPFILTIIYLVFERYITRDGYEKKLDFKIMIQNLGLLVYLALLCFTYYATLELDFMQNKFQTVSNKSLFKYPSNPALTIKNFGTTIYFILDVKGTITGPISEEYSPDSNDGSNNPVDDSRKIDDSAWDSLSKVEEDPSMITLNSYFKNRTIYPTNDYTGKFKDKNLIVIMMESIGEAVFHEDYKEYFPTLYKLYNEGITGKNNYSPRNNCATGESEMTSQISLYSIETTCTVNTYKNNEYKEALLYMLKKNNYFTSTYHNYTELYYSRSVFEYKLGASRYYGVNDLGVSYDLAYKEWPSDLELMEKAIPKFIDQERFASYMITVSAHTPYIFSSKMGNKHLSLFKDTNFPTNTKRYLSKVKELDLAIEYLIKSLDEKGKLDDTVIVLFGDHYPYGLNDKDYGNLAQYDIKTNAEVDRTPFIIYNSATSKEEITKYTTPMDYTPTLLNLFGIEYDPRLYLGHDIFSEYTDYAVFPDNSWQSSAGYYSTSKGEFIPKEGEELVSEEEDIIKINKEINDMRSMSGLAIKKNYFNYLFKYFEEYEKLEKEKAEKEEKEKEETEESEE
ncbi:MAG: sulfatase-like hydrolase/transferase [Bacilli bacterium]|nr:sulfatase-like hydrolase/transferase [Bacilli bacterium]